MAESEAESRFRMTKERHKESLAKAVKDKKMDSKALPICKFLHSQSNYFTSSSCSGRIVLMLFPKKEIKGEGIFFKKWHDKPNYNDFKKGIAEKPDGILWLKVEPFIFHIETNSLDNANVLLASLREAGLRRYGIQVVKPGKFMIELMGSNYLSLPIMQKNQLLFDEHYLKFIFKKAAEKFELNQKALKRFESQLKKDLKKSKISS